MRATAKSLYVLASLPPGLLALRYGAQRRVLGAAREKSRPGGISAVETVTLGGVRQRILIQGEDRTTPVLLVLHGGPGMPFPGVSYRTLSPFGRKDSELFGRFVLVYWDQRGCGTSGGPDVPKESITIDRLVSDTVELADLLRQRFGVRKIFLAALSWGTVLGLGAVARAPERFHAYVGVEQIVDWARSDELAYRWAVDRAEESGNRRAMEQLAGIGAPPWRDFERWSTLRLWLMLFGGFYRAEGAPAWRRNLSRAVPFLAPGLPALLSPFFTSPDYGLGDLLRLLPRMKTSTEALLDDIARLDYSASVPKVEVPVCFFHGVHDRAVQPSVTRRYVEDLEATGGKRLIPLENSAHIPSPEDARAIEAFLAEQLPGMADRGVTSGGG